MSYITRWFFLYIFQFTLKHFLSSRYDDDAFLLNWYLLSLVERSWCVGGCIWYHNILEISGDHENHKFKLSNRENNNIIIVCWIKEDKWCWANKRLWFIYLFSFSSSCHFYSEYFFFYCSHFIFYSTVTLEAHQPATAYIHMNNSNNTKKYHQVFCWEKTKKNTTPRKIITLLYEKKYRTIF